MNGRLFVIPVLILGLCLAGCKTERTMKEISHVSYTSDAGPILPELQWREQIVIAKDKVTLTRVGSIAGSEVNDGTWQLALDVQQAATLFAGLQNLDCAALERVEAQDAPDGGHSESFTIHYADGQTCSLYYDPGTTYSGGEHVVQPVQAFLQGLVFPPEAASRYKPSAE